MHAPREGSVRIVADITYHVEGNIYVFSRGKGLEDEHITLDLVAVDLRRALKLACAQVDANYAFDLGEYATRRVTLLLYDVRFGEAITAILQTAKLPEEIRYENSHDMVIVGRLYHWSTNGDDPLPYLHDKIDLHAVHQSLYNVIWAVCIAKGGNFTLTQLTRLASVTKNLNQTPFDQAAKILLRHSKVSLTFKVDQGIVEILERYGPKMMR